MYIAGAICTLTAPILLFCPCMWCISEQKSVWAERSSDTYRCGKHADCTEERERNSNKGWTSVEWETSEREEYVRRVFTNFLPSPKKFVQSGVSNSFRKYTVKQKVTNAQAFKWLIKVTPDRQQNKICSDLSWKSSVAKNSTKNGVWTCPMLSSLIACGI